MKRKKKTTFETNKKGHFNSTNPTMYMEYSDVSDEHRHYFLRKLQDFISERLKHSSGYQLIVGGENQPP